MKKLAIFLLLSVSAWAQTTLTQTTLSAAVNGGLPNAATATSVQSYVILGSLTGITGIASGGTTQIRSVLYVDKEEMAVQSVNSSTNTVNVLRGYNGTLATPHNSGAVVFVGTPDQFYQFDPAGGCTAGNTKVTPWININSGNQWTCTNGLWTFAGGPYFGGTINSYTIGGTLPAASSVPVGTLAKITNALSAGSCVNGGGTALSLCYSNGAAWQPIGDGGGGAVPAGPLVVTATNFGVTANTKIVWDATVTNSSQTVTCPNSDCNFTSADVGKVVYATNLANTGFNNFINSALILPQGTISSLNSANSIQVSLAATGTTCTASCLLVWGTDDTTALQNAWTATVAVCGVLLLPAGKMLTNQPQFNGISGVNACLNGVGGSRAGFGIHGYDISSTWIMPTPNFSYSSCTFGGSGLVCFFGVVDGMNVTDLEVFGSGLNNSNSTKTGVLFSGNNNSYIHDVSCIAWGAASATGLLIGMQFQAGTSEYERVEDDGCGKYGIKVTGGGAAPSGSFTHLVSQDTPAPLWITATTYTTESIIESTVSGACLVGVNSGATWFSHNDNIGEHLSGGNGACIGAEPFAQGSTGGGFAYFTGSNIDLLANSGDGAIIVLGSSGNYASITGNRFAGTANQHGVVDPFAAGTYIIDGGGNKFLTTGTTLGYASASGAWINFNSAAVAQVAGNWTLSAGWGTTATVTACQGNAILQQCTVTSNGTGQAANPTIAITAPLDGPTTAYPYVPSCVATNVFGGTGALAAMQGTVAPTTTSSGTYQWTGTPVAASTYIVQVRCQ